MASVLPPVLAVRRGSKARKVPTNQTAPFLRNTALLNQAHCTLLTEKKVPFSIIIAAAYMCSWLPSLPTITRQPISYLGIPNYDIPYFPTSRRRPQVHDKITSPLPPDRHSQAPMTTSTA